MKVFIRAGHGGSDSGATSPSKIGGQTKHFYEKNINLSVALACRDYLKAYNCEVIMARETDKKLVVEETVKQAQALGCDVFLEIHHNAANGQGRGCEIWYWHTDTKAKQLAEITLDELVKLGVKSRGLKPSSNESKSFKVCRMNNKKIPAILGEFCFLDNATDQKLIDTPKQLQAQGEAYGKAVVRFLGLKLKQTPATPSTPSTPSKPPVKDLKYKIGDIVQFTGGAQYKSSTSSTGYTAKASWAKITAVAPGAKYPYHLRAVDENGKFIGGVYGWVDESTVTDAAAAPVPFKPVVLPPTPTPEKEWVPKIGDVMHWFPKHGKNMDTFRAAVKALLATGSTTPSPTVPAPTPTATTGEEKIWKFFKDKGLNDFAIAGLMGNLYAESGLRSNNLQNTYEKSLGMTDEQYTKAVDAGTYANFVNDSAGYGLAQWTYWSRKEALLKFTKEAKASIGDLDTQLAYLWKELQGYANTIKVLKSATSVRQASDVVLLEYERPADQSEAVKVKRAQYGQGYYDKYASKPVAPAPVLKSIDVIAKEVIAGKWGNGEARKQKLTAAGYNYATVQQRVNQLLK